MDELNFFEKLLYKIADSLNEVHTNFIDDDQTISNLLELYGTMRILDVLLDSKLDEQRKVLQSINSILVHMSTLVHDEENIIEFDAASEELVRTIRHFLEVTQ